MRIRLYIILMVLGLPALAQDMAQFRVIYQGSGKLSNRDYNKRVIQWNLDIGEHSSYFYNPVFKAMKQEVRQLDSNTQNDKNTNSLNDAFAIMDKYPLSTRYAMEVYCNYPEQGVYTYEWEQLKPLLYSDKLPAIDWHLTDSTKQISSYTCKQASGRVAGREWKVWYTVDIPYSYGPWLLTGLPGLVLEAEDTEHYFHFLAQGTERLDTPEPMVLISEDTAIPCTHERFLELRQLCYMNPEQYAFEVTGFDERGNNNYKERNKGLERYCLDREEY